MHFRNFSGVAIVGSLASSIGLLSACSEDATRTTGRKIDVVRDELTLNPLEAGWEASLAATLQRLPSDATIRVDIDINDIDRAKLKAATPYPQHEASGGTDQPTMVNGSEATQADMDALNTELRAAIASRREVKKLMRYQKAEEALREFGVSVPADFEGSRLSIVLPRATVEAILQRDPDQSGVRGIRESGVEVRIDDDMMDSALDSIEVGNVAFPLGQDGDGIGIWWNDGPDDDYAFGYPGPGCPTGDQTRQDPGETSSQHATYTFCILRTAAPEAHIHVAEPTEDCNLRTDVGTFSNPPVYVSSISHGYYDDFDSDYDDCERDWDNFVEDERIAHFAATGNEAESGSGYVRGAAQAYNTFGVGSYDDEASPDAVSVFSNWRDPETGADKPEIVVPGEINIPTWGDPFDDGTSYAAPMAAGFAADLMEGQSQLYNRPYLLKAHLIANAVSIEAGESKDGHGRLDYYNAHYYGWWWWGEGTESEVFNGNYDSDSKPDRTLTYTLVSGRTYTVATSWLVDGTYVRANNNANIKVRLTVKAPNGTTWHDYDSTQSHQLLTFTAPQNGTYQVIMEQEVNPNDDDVAIGLYVNW